LTSLGHPSKFQRVLRLASLLQRHRLLESHQTLHDVWPSPGLIHYIYNFGGSCPLTEICPVQNSLYTQVLCSHILAALLHGTPAAGVSQTLRCGTRNGITKLSQRAPPIIGRAAIALGIGPHSSIVIIVIVRPHCSTTYVDAAYSYRPSSVVCWSICQSVTLVSPAKTAALIELPFGLRTWVGPGNHVLDGGPDPPWEVANFWGRMGVPL